MRTVSGLVRTKSLARHYETYGGGCRTRVPINEASSCTRKKLVVRGAAPGFLRRCSNNHRKFEDRLVRGLSASDGRFSNLTPILRPARHITWQWRIIFAVLMNRVKLPGNGVGVVNTRQAPTSETSRTAHSKLWPSNEIVPVFKTRRREVSLRSSTVGLISMSSSL